MGEYFKPLRRKLGVLTLGIACVFAVGWARSLNLGDVFYFKLNDQLYSIHSAHSSLKCVKEKLIHNITSRVPNPLDPNGGSVPRMIRIELAPPPSWQDYRSYESSRKMLALYQLDDPTLASLSYASIVFPLTLLSAWLLLSKPRLKRAALEPEHA